MRTTADANDVPGERPGELPDQLAGYRGWGATVRAAAPFRGPGRAATELGRVLGVVRLRPGPVQAGEPTVLDGVEVRRLSWALDYGPRTGAWLLRPAGEPGPLPGVLGLHCHGGVRSVGAESMLDPGPGASRTALRLRGSWYGGRAPANDLARRGFAVLVHDAFSWGSRAFDLSDPAPPLADRLAAYRARWREQNRTPGPDECFDLVSGWHEETLAKAAGLFGQTFAGAVLSDDLAALEVLAGLDGVDADRLGVFGFSGGGGRSLLLAGIDHRLRACAVACMMATFDSLVPQFLDHSWLLHIPGLWRLTDWPGLVDIGRADYLVQYRRDDPLFPPAGMAAAHEWLSRHTAARYRSTFRPGGHQFDAEMQAEAWAFLAGVLERPAGR